MLDRLFDGADPIIADAIWFLIVVPILDRIRWIFKTRECRAALQSALHSGVDLVTDALVRIIIANPIGYSVDKLAGEVVDYTERSTPDSIKFLLSKPWFMRLFGMKPVPIEQQRAWLETMAIAKLQARATELLVKLRPDALTEALTAAGARAVRP